MPGIVAEDAPQRLCMAPVDGRQLGVVAHVRVGRVGLDLEAASGSQGAGFEAVADLAQQLLQPLGGTGADHVVGPGLLGDDVGRIAALGHEAVDAVVGQDLLAQQGDGRLGHDHGVGSVDAQPGEARGMRLATRVGDGQLLHRDDARARPRPW